MTDLTDSIATGRKPGLTLHAPAAYDLLVWLLTLGRERAFREAMLRWAQLRSGESVLDVGSGTGTLAIAAKRHVGAAGAVYGLDASPEMVARAQKKARRAGVDVTFGLAFAQSLPVSEGQFDVVLTTLMLHHLPRQGRRELAAETRRVLRPGGRVLAIDFGAPSRPRRGVLEHLHRRHGYVEPRDVIALLSEAGLSIEQSGAVGTRDLHFVLATRPRDA